MQLHEINTEPFELKSFSRKQYPEDHLKDRLIIRQLRKGQNNFLLESDTPDNRPIQSGVNHE